MSKTETKNQTNWCKLFEQHNIIDKVNEKGLYEIEAKEINKFREARLMTKFDHKINLPQVFSDNDLSILPITRGKYIISHFDAYKNFEEENCNITYMNFPEYIESIDYNNITSESIAINCAFVSGMLNDFLDKDELFPTVSGRMSSRDFSFQINNTNLNSNIQINVSNSQIEIDGGYESLDSLAIIEAKNTLPQDFLVRQIYYPYRLWNNLINKNIKPIYMLYSNDIFSFYEYCFEDHNNYNSLYLVKHKRYCLDDGCISIPDIEHLIKTADAKSIECTDIPFPQADDFKKIINLCELLKNVSKTKDDIASEYSFDIRQSEYYANAGRYLGLINKNKEKEYSLSDKGNSIFKQKHREKQLSLVKLILCHNIFKRVLEESFKKGNIIENNEIVSIMKQENLNNISSDSTFKRRSSTIRSWIDWIISLTY